MYWSATEMRIIAVRKFQVNVKGFSKQRKADFCSWVLVFAQNRSAVKARQKVDVILTTF
jgi:hypothetical protein